VVEIIIPFTDKIIEGGTFVFHCQILEHEDKGMMATIRVGPSETGDGLCAMSSNTDQHHH